MKKSSDLFLEGKCANSTNLPAAQGLNSCLPFLNSFNDISLVAPTWSGNEMYNLQSNQLDLELDGDRVEVRLAQVVLTLLVTH